MRLHFFEKNFPDDEPGEQFRFSHHNLFIILPIFFAMKRFASSTSNLNNSTAIYSMLQLSGFHILSFLKPESVILLTLTSKEMHTLLSDEIIKNYGKKLKPEIEHYGKKFGVSYRKCFINELQNSSRTPSDYKIQADLFFEYSDPSGHKQTDRIDVNQFKTYKQHNCDGTLLSETISKKEDEVPHF